MEHFLDVAVVRIDVVDRVPPVWRRLLMSPWTKLGGLHRMILAAFDLSEALPHRFVLNGDVYGRVAPGEALDAKRERNWRLDSAGYPDRWFRYEYGESNPVIVRITTEEYNEAPELWRYPRCVGGSGELVPSRSGFTIASVNRRLWRAMPRR